ncbi:MAG: hypothetical protein COZ75_01100 [Flavobacteriaceae bacterium CG_4_8_14_3_um_filter_34_10]|nr:hypothetical protein [Flavobacteriia bacterium]OIP50276.1 MAG: hypothetical protein AUK33_08060 [Flavobacteriaceae bacterium CG2_30_34_30]PIQ19624.1 MAG: hypothetical protein COW66_00155 [Flavobacteriaceae bacterium CG18_big_fil_WC_8_21_14_2_50_34_36]PIV49047.1 MAG: hypothetical protein COS19_10595 [Flavobacteriaceae bacterium CG02_land_8_20_14_3_00_34_13]PIX10548.1 MAG: hypothetical protein COZ75_01100 [Flavobacteriaceae bacterium CG_4_8_14_3_um_filter_34_10]PIZ08515.1 MAG: hypothetical pr
MIKILGFILTICGAIALVLGVLDAFGNIGLGFSPWALIILGIVFFFAGIGLLKHQNDTDGNPSD